MYCNWFFEVIFKPSPDITQLHQKVKKWTYPFDIRLFLHYQFCKTTLWERYQHYQKDILYQIYYMPNCSFDHHGNSQIFQLWTNPVKNQEWGWVPASKNVTLKCLVRFYLSYLMRFLAPFVIRPKKVSSSSLGISAMTLAAVVESNEF